MKYWNFVYCDTPRWRTEPIWSMNVFIKAFNYAIWLCVVLEIISVCLALGFKNAGLDMLAILSIMLCSGLGSKLVGKRILFPVFCLLNQVLINIYSGDMYSRLISPPDEDVLESLADLNKLNYSAVTKDSHERPN